MLADGTVDVAVTYNAAAEKQSMDSGSAVHIQGEYVYSQWRTMSTESLFIGSLYARWTYIKSS
jgi:hypothetical protein